MTVALAVNVDDNEVLLVRSQSQISLYLYILHPFDIYNYSYNFTDRYLPD